MQSETNQKLLFAQSQLEFLTAALERAQTPRDQLLARGLADACVYQLMAVWHSLLREILANYRVPLSSSALSLGADMVVGYVEACEQQDLVAPELNYTLNLAKDGQSGLGQLLALFDKALVASIGQENFAESEAKKSTENLIALQQVGEEGPLQAQCDQLGHILEEIRILIQHCRQTMQEY